MEGKVLYATLYRQWFDQVARGTKKTEYRQMSDYWVKKLVDVERYAGKDVAEIKNGIVGGKLTPHWRDWTHVRFKCGNNYVVCEIKGISVYRGHDVFCIKLGKVTPQNGAVNQ